MLEPLVLPALPVLLVPPVALFAFASLALLVAPVLLALPVLVPLVAPALLALLVVLVVLAPLASATVIATPALSSADALAPSAEMVT